MSFADDLDKDLLCLFSHLLQRSPERRMSLLEALHHPALHAFVGHIRRSPPVNGRSTISCMHTTTENNNLDEDRLIGRHIGEHIASSDTEVMLRQTEEDVVTGASMPASPEGSDHDDACCDFDCTMQNVDRAGRDVSLDDAVSNNNSRKHGFAVSSEEVVLREENMSPLPPHSLAGLANVLVSAGDAHVVDKAKLRSLEEDTASTDGFADGPNTFDCSRKLTTHTAAVL